MGMRPPSQAGSVVYRQSPRLAMHTLGMGCREARHHGPMIDLYYAATPNGLKMTMCLHELGLPFRLNRVLLSKGEQHRPEFLALSPNNKIPAMVDHAPADGGEPVVLFESGALL